MPSKNQDLISEFTKGQTGSSPNADLINHFSKGAASNSEIVPQQNGSNIPQPGAVPTTDYKPENQFIKDVKNAPYSWANRVVKNFKQGRDLAGQGVTDITQGKTATGVGEVVWGGLGAAVAPITATIESADRFAQKVSGNPKFKPAEFATMTGAPVMKTASAVSQAAPSTRAITELVNVIGKENIPAAIAQLRSNPRLTLMDVDPNAQRVAMGLAAEPGEPLSVLDKFSKARKDNQKGAVIEAYDEAMGVPVSMKKQIDTLKANIRDVGKDINPIVANSKPVDLTSVISNIDNILKPGVNSVITAGNPLPSDAIQKELRSIRRLITDDKSQKTDAKQLHTLQSNIRARAEDLLNSTDGQNRQIGHALMNVRNQIVSAIDNASPQMLDANGKAIGSYRPQLSKYRDANDIDDAFKKGQLITRNKLGQLDDHPEFWQDWISKASPEEIKAAQEGARLAVAHQMGAFRFSARKGMELPESEFNAEKLSMLFGKKETDKLMKVLNDERKINDTDTKLFQNSQTAMRLLAQKATEVREGYKPDANAFLPAAAEIGAATLTSGASIGLVAPTIIGYHTARKGIRNVGRKLDRNTNVEIANLASATGEAKEALIKALQDQLPKNNLTMKQKLQLAFPATP